MANDWWLCRYDIRKHCPTTGCLVEDGCARGLDGRHEVPEQKTIDIEIAVVVDDEGQWDARPYYAPPDFDRLSVCDPRGYEHRVLVRATVPLPEFIAATVDGEAEVQPNKQEGERDVSEAMPGIKTDRYIGSGFRAELTDLLNRYCMESGSDTPDFILAEYLTNCLHAFDDAVTARTDLCERFDKKPTVEDTTP